MKRLIFTSLITTLTLSAYNAEVIKASVILEVNQKSQSHKIGDKFTLNGGDLVCFISGDGKVLIKGENKYSKKLSKRSRCKNLPKVKKDSKNYIELAGSAIVSTFGEAQEQIGHGASTRSVITASTEKRDITIAKSAKYLIIENKNWGPLPVSVKILDTTGKVVAEDVNEDEDIRTFVFPVSVLKNGYRVNVIDGFDVLLVDSLVHFLVE